MSLPLTKDEEALIRLRYPYDGARVLSPLMGRSESSIKSWAFRLGVKKLRREVFTERVNQAYFKGEMTPNKAYVGGYLWADGGLLQNYISLKAHPVDRDIVLGVRGEMDSTHAVEETSSVIRCYIAGQGLVSDALRLFGMDFRKSYKDLPFPGIPTTYLPHFVRGVLDGDGYVCQERNEIGWCGTKQFIEGLQEAISQNLGISKHPLSHSGENTWKAYWCSLEHLQLLYKWMYPANLYGKRKKELLEKRLCL